MILPWLSISVHGMTHILLFNLGAFLGLTSHLKGESGLHNEHSQRTCVARYKRLTITGYPALQQCVLTRELFH